MKEPETKGKERKHVYASDHEVIRIIEKNLEKDKHLLEKLAKL